MFFQHKDAYQVILDGVKGGPKEKRLAAQFVPKFFSSFPELADAAINAQLDLCEDEDVSVSTSSYQRFACCGCETRKHILTLLVHLSWFPDYRLEGRLSRNCPVSHQERIYPESQTFSHSCCRQVGLTSTKTLVFRLLSSCISG